jgi:hypothetical protein
VATVDPTDRLTSNFSSHTTQFADLLSPGRKVICQRKVNPRGSAHGSASEQQAALAQSLAPLVGHLRQIIETANDKLLNTFRLARERPHDLTGF